MNSKLILGGALAAQVLISAGLYVNNLSNSAGAPPVPLLAFEQDKVDRIVVDDRSKTVTLTREGEEWRLPELQELGANEPKIATLFRNLKDITTRWPVVNSASGRQRFEVEDDNYQRKLSFYQGETLLGTYYFGTAPAFRRTHVRREGEGEVYVVPFNNFDLPTDGNDWLEKELLAVNNVTRIEGPDYTLTKDGDNWQLANVTDAPALKQSQIDAMTRSWRSLRVMRVADSVPEDAESTEVSVASKDGEWRYMFSKTKDSCFISREGLDTTFTTTLSDCETLAGTKRSALVELPSSNSGSDSEEEGPAADPASF